MGLQEIKKAVNITGISAKGSICEVAVKTLNEIEKITKEKIPGFAKYKKANNSTREREAKDYFDYLAEEKSKRQEEKSKKQKKS